MASNTVRYRSLSQPEEIGVLDSPVSARYAVALHSPCPPQPVVDATTALREALNQGISSGNLIDTKIILYSHRDFSGRICRPKVLYTNSYVLKTVPYFKDLLFGDFSESQSRDFEDPIDEEERAEDYAYLSDSDLEDDEDERALSSNYTVESEVHPFDPFATSSKVKTDFEEYQEHVERGKVVKIPDMAFITFQAFLMYLYTDKITFAPFGSEENRRSRSMEKMVPSNDKVPRPSPKSIYRLADKYDVRSLKRRALDHIREELNNCNIVDESFSKFASQYDEIRSLYIKHLASLWTDGPAIGTIRSSVERKIKTFAKGDLEHAMEMLSELWGVANSDVNPPSSDTRSFSIRSVEEIPHLSSVMNLDAAFISSIRNGVFFDRKYWVRHSKAGLKPIYLSSTILKDKVRFLNTVVKCVKGKNPPIEDLEGDVNVESDCDEETPEIEVAPSTEGAEEETCAVLIAGSFAAWKSLFFCCCTDAISFAPLKSQGVDSRLDYIRGNTRAAAPPPCSPKSVYVLANLLDIQPLCDRALVDIRSKTTLENVVSEVFSWVTAGQREIMEMQCDLLVSKFNDPRTIESVKERIRQISDGSSSHRAGALQLGFEKAFEFRAKKKQPQLGVKLVCGVNYCQRRGIQVICASLLNNTTCPSCKGYTLCANCRQARNGNYLSCTSCGRKFA